MPSENTEMTQLSETISNVLFVRPTDDWLSRINHECDRVPSDITRTTQLDASITNVLSVRPTDA